MLRKRLRTVGAAKGLKTEEAIAAHLKIPKSSYSGAFTGGQILAEEHVRSIASFIDVDLASVKQILRPATVRKSSRIDYAREHHAEIIHDRVAEHAARRFETPEGLIKFLGDVFADASMSDAEQLAAAKAAVSAFQERGIVQGSMKVASSVADQAAMVDIVLKAVELHSDKAAQPSKPGAGQSRAASPEAKPLPAAEGSDQD